ncbi:hypothetical protein BDR26DRAFT_59108 [Obelidium mucronatum]|nr:hypothetical protein BDR26DRAFT_59108 [Obelidium mucronatum]
MLASRIVIHSLLSESPRNRALNNIRIPRVKRNRDRYIENYSNLFHFFQDKSDLEMVVWQKAYDAEQLVGLYDWIWLLDAGDAMIMNADIDLRVLLGRLILEAGYTADIVIAKDLKTLNAGSFFLRSSKWTKEFILAWKRWMDIPRMNEQHAIVGMTEKNELEINKHILVVPQSRQNLFNSYCFGKEPTFKKGDFVLHAPSKGYNYMIECMDKFNVTEVGFES